MKPLSIIDKAIDYRKKGYSYNIISERLGLGKSTIANWLKEVPYTPNEEVLRRIKAGPAKAAQIQQQRKIATIKTIKTKAKKEFGILSKRDLWLLGIGLYLGEGRKLQEVVRIINSDPQIIKACIVWFKKICGLKTENFNPTVYSYPNNNIKNTVNYWSKITGVPKKQFGKTQIDQRTNKSGKKKRKLPYGTLHLQIKSCGKKEFGKNLHRRIVGWIEGTLSQI